MIKPYSQEAEQSVLGCFLLDGATIYKINQINENMFYLDAHKKIFNAIKSIVDTSNNLRDLERNGVDIVLIINELKKDNVILESIGGISYITSLSTIVPSASNIDFYINILRDKYLKRNTLASIESISLNINTMNQEQLLQELDMLKDEILNSSSIEDTFVNAGDIKLTKNNIESIATGISKLDKLTEGLPYGTLSILSGKPSSGKSTIINQIFIAEAINQSQKVFLYSGELPHFQAMKWLLKTIADNQHLEIKVNKYGTEYVDVNRYGKELIQKWLDNKLFLYGEEAEVTDKSILSIIEYLHIKKGVRVFVLDNLMTINVKGDDKYEKQKYMVSELKDLAKKYGLVIVLVAHPRKNMGNEIPTMYDISGASEIANLADYIFWTHRKIERDKDIDETSLLVLKNRTNGKQDYAIKVNYSDQRKRFYTDGDELGKVYSYLPEFTQVDLDDAPF